MDRIAWYLIKLGMSIGRFKEKPDAGNLMRTLKTINQISSRLGVDSKELTTALKTYGASQDKEHLMQLNEALKKIYIEIIQRHIIGQK